MIVWLNGAHGAGKTTTNALLQPLIPDARVFDAEKVGETLMDITPGLPETDNFQHWPPWRPLVVETAYRVLDYTGGTLVIPMTVLIEKYWLEISTGLARHAIPVRHFVLHADRDTLRGRIEREHHPPPVPVSSQLSRAVRGGRPDVAARGGRGRRHHAPHSRGGGPADRTRRPSERLARRHLVERDTGLDAPFQVALLLERVGRRVRSPGRTPAQPE